MKTEKNLLERKKNLQRKIINETNYANGLKNTALQVMDRIDEFEEELKIVNAALAGIAQLKKEE